MHQLQLTPTKLVPCGVALRYLNCRPCVGTCVPVKGLDEKTDELDKGEGFKRREIPGRVRCKFSTDREHEIHTA